MPPDVKTVSERFQRFEATLRERGLKITHQRSVIFRELAASDDHPDAESIYQRVHELIPAISRDTVYRTLTFLEENGLVGRAEVRSGPVRYDADVERHHHFVCRSCGLVRDVHSEEFDHIPIPESVAAIGRVIARQLQLQGLCERCDRKMKG
jgi:Fur family transcriptional regulator, peroxide stress response regulator